MDAGGWMMNLAGRWPRTLWIGLTLALPAPAAGHEGDDNRSDTTRPGVIARYEGRSDTRRARIVERVEAVPGWRVEPAKRLTPPCRQSGSMSGGRAL